MKTLLFLVGMNAMAACVPVNGDRIMGSELMPGLPSSMVIGFAPMPGEKRVFTAGEQAGLAKANGIPAGELTEICFEIPLRTIAKADVARAMAKALPAAAQLEILELGKTEAPVGEIEFPLSSLEPADAAGAHMWRGGVRYSSTRKAPIWARVKIQGPLKSPLAVRRGETVRVDVASGFARLHFEAVAESDAREGEVVSLKNPLSGKTFRAKVVAGGKAMLVI